MTPPSVIAAFHFLENGMGASAGTSRRPVAFSARTTLIAPSTPSREPAALNRNASKNAGA